MRMSFILRRAALATMLRIALAPRSTTLREVA